jgi:hypothetical protein
MQSMNSSHSPLKKDKGKRGENESRSESERETMSGGEERGSINAI